MHILTVGKHMLCLRGMRVIRHAGSVDPDAWLDGEWVTVEVTETLNGLRVHTNGVEYREGSPMGKRPKSNAKGAWVMIGDSMVGTADEVVHGHSLPGKFTHVGTAIIPVGAEMNVGFCSAILAGKKDGGGGVQAEWVGGKRIDFAPLPGRVWLNYAGHS